MSTVSTGRRGPEFYADMTADELAAHRARDNGDLSQDMVVFDEQIARIEAMSASDRAAVAVMHYEELKNRG